MEQGIPLWQFLGAVTLTMCSFLPELDGVQILQEGEILKQLEIDGPTVQLSDGLLSRRLFSGYVGTRECVYLPMEDGTLYAYEEAVAPMEALSPRALIETLLELAALPDGLAPSDLLGVRGGKRSCNGKPFRKLLQCLSATGRSGRTRGGIRPGQYALSPAGNRRGAPAHRRKRCRNTFPENLSENSSLAQSRNFGHRMISTFLALSH